MSWIPTHAASSRAGLRTALAAALLALIPANVRAQTSSPAGAPDVRVVSDASGKRLQVDGRDFMVFGMNWDYVPIGENYVYSLWTQPDEVIEAALAYEMPLLKEMGVNAIRQYVGIPPRWVRTIFERYGICTVVNHPMARYGFTLDGVWIPSVDYSDPRLREAVKAEIVAMVDAFEGTPGVLMWLLGNENNYGLSWKSNEIEALPEGERDTARARYLYSLYGEITRAIKERDPHRPVAIANGDLQYIDVIAEECRDIDILGTNVYRGISARDLFEVVEAKLGIPVMFAEFGADAWNAKEMREDQENQAKYLLGQWREIYEQSAGKGRVGNAIGGFVFQWSDGWWKFGQESRLDAHDTNASWPNGGYPEDYVEGENNMNEEWWGICAKGPSDVRGIHPQYPRAAYYALQRAFRLDPYASTTDLGAIEAHFRTIEPVAAALQARADRASLLSNSLDLIRLSGVRLEFETYSTGGSNISTPPAETPQEALPSYLGFDHMQSFWTDFEIHPAGNVTGTLSLNILGHVPLNPIDEIFYENRGRSQTLVAEDGEIVRLEGIERLKVYGSSVFWDDRWFRLDGFYRTGHVHWGYEGDFFGIYRDAYYGENLDTYNGEAPVGAEIAAKKWMDGLKVAFGPELHWGANPSFIAKYRRQIGSVTATGLYQDEFAEQTQVTSSIAIPIPPTQRATLVLETGLGPFDVSAGGIWAGNTKNGETFLIADERDDETVILQDHVRPSDNWGAKGKLTWERGRWHWYAQGAYAGIVADGGPTATTTFTGWSLKDTGIGNGTNLITGLAVNTGNFQIAPNVLWQKPLVGPIPGDAPPPGRPRNQSVFRDPFAVRANRETVGAELMLTHDPTPATWMWTWDNDVREDAKLAWSLGVIYRDAKTTQDAATGILADGTPFAFPGATPPRELWEVKLRAVSRLSSKARLVTNWFAGTGEPNGNDQRLIHRYGVEGRLALGTTAFAMHAKFDDWGPYDYHRDFNLTFPVQLMGDISYTLGMPKWFGDPQTRVGVRTAWRTLDVTSPRYVASEDLGTEWEIRTYMHVAI